LTRSGRRLRIDQFFNHEIEPGQQSDTRFDSPSALLLKRSETDFSRYTSRFLLPIIYHPRGVADAAASLHGMAGVTKLPFSHFHSVFPTHVLPFELNAGIQPALQICQRIIPG
jgi:hypothetical protein